jgi:SNF2-related domain
MAKDNVVTRTLNHVPQHKGPNVWVEKRWLYYVPTFFPSHEVKEWGARWEKGSESWRMPRLVRYARRIKEYDPDATFTKDALRLAKGEIEKQDAEVFWANLKDEAEAHPAWEELKDFQKLGVMAMVVRAFHGQFLLLSPGLGKTPVSIVAADLYLKFKGNSQRVCIVAPLSLLENWEREINGTQIVNPLLGQKQIQWSDDPRIEICHGIPPTGDRTVKWTITNYETPMERVLQSTNPKDPDADWRTLATGNLDEDWDLDWDLVIYDESVMLKNRKSLRTTSHRTLARAADRVIKNSASPVTHDNSDAWAQLNMIEPDYFSAFWRFAAESCVITESDWSKYNIEGSRHDFILREEYPELIFARAQEDVFDELPEILYEDIPLPLTKKQQKAHDDILTDWIHMLEKEPDKRVEVTAVIAMLTRLQQVTSNLYNLETTGQKWPDESTKADFVVEDLTRGDIEWPSLIWVWHRPGAQALLKRLQKLAKSPKNGDALYGKRVELVVGGMRKKADEYISAYKAGDVDVLILSIGVGKYGHTLANSKTIYAYDKTWDSDAWFQMLHRYGGARALMTGQLHSPLVKTLRCRGTVDDFVELNLAGKLPAMASMTGADLSKILRSLGEEHVEGT